VPLTTRTLASSACSMIMSITAWRALQPRWRRLARMAQRSLEH
jgi:hypothetical protein